MSPLTGPCADSICENEPASNACAYCVVAHVGEGAPCDAEEDACIKSGACDPFLYLVDWENPTHEVIALRDCLCTPGVCVD